MFGILLFLTKNSWFIWPVCLAIDFILSKRRLAGVYKLTSLRWIFRICHSLTAAAVIMVVGVEYFYLDILNIHRHGGPETFIAGPVSFFIEFFLAMLFDKAPLKEKTSGGIYLLLSYVLPFLSFACVIFIGLDSIYNIIPNLYLMPLSMFLIPVLMFMLLVMQSFFEIYHYHKLFYAGLTLFLFIALVAAWIAADFKIFGFLPWGKTNDDLWYILSTGFVCFGILFGSSFFKVNKPLSANIKEV